MTVDIHYLFIRLERVTLIVSFDIWKKHESFYVDSSLLLASHFWLFFSYLSDFFFQCILVLFLRWC